MTTVPKLQVSVAMCTYNGARFIEEQLWSIFRQSYLPVELIVSDDNSTDETLAIVQRVYETACQEIEGVAQIKLLVLKNKEPLGVSKNFEKALSFCNSDLIALSDQDDVWKIDKLKRLVPLFEINSKLLFVFSDSQLVDSNGSTLGYSSFEALRVSQRETRLFSRGKGSQVLLKRNLATGAASIFRKELLKKATPFAPNWLHDEWLAFVASYAGEIYLCEERLIDYRQHGNNQIGMKKPNLRHYIGRLIFPRKERNEVLFARATNMCNHPFFAGNNDRVRAEVQGKFEHELSRNAFPESRFKRFKPIIAEMRTGRYGKYGLGIQDCIRDLIQPS